MLGQPDVEIYTLTENVAVVDRIVNLVNKPVFADADTGYGNVINMARTVRVFEKTGAVAIQPQGVSVDLAREAARRLRLPIELVAFNSAGNVVEAVKARQVDLAFVAIDPVRAADTDYTAPYVIIEGAYLVRDESPLRRNDEVDRAGTRIVVGRGSAYDIYLTRAIKSATLVRVPTSPEVTNQLIARNLEVSAGVRQQQLEVDAKRLNGSGASAPRQRMLPGRFMVIEQAMDVPKGHTAALVEQLHRRDEGSRIRRGCVEATRHQRRQRGAGTRG